MSVFQDLYVSMVNVLIASTLIIATVLMDSLESIVNCQVGNSIKIIEAIFVIQYTHFIAPVLTSVPSIVEPPQPTTTSLNSMIFLTCNATGNPQPSITWSKNGVELAGRNGPRLEFSSVSPTDRGLYQCQATNSEGTQSSMAVYLTINGMYLYIC